jgi:peptidoglycan/LPS O-acetylase OafA/YrhL
MNAFRPGRETVDLPGRPRSATTIIMKRMPALDGLRGILAVVVAMHHVCAYAGSGVLLWPAQKAVLAFFFLSGLVLTRAWAGHVWRFMVRRIVRLWPTYAVCLAAGYVALGQRPIWAEFLWLRIEPTVSPMCWHAADPPMWSLCIEMWVMPFMPFIAWFGRGSPARMILAVIACAALTLLGGAPAYGAFFVAGAALSRFTFQSKALESRVPLWLGKVSYSLYLSHWVVFKAFTQAFGHYGLIPGAVACPAVAWVLWRWVERPSVTYSRSLFQTRASGPDRAITAT